MTTVSSLYKMTVDVIRNKLGYVIFDDAQDDFPIADYIPDSLTFISFIIFIEEGIGLQLSDDFLDYDILSSAKGFAEKLSYFIETRDKEKDC